MLNHHSHTHRDIVKGKTIHVFINGDLFFEAKAFVVTPKTDRTFESLLTRLTDLLNPRFGAVLHLKTVDGASEVKSLDELVSGASYVAYGKKFQALDYNDISSRLRALSHPTNVLASPREFRKLVVSGRARKIVRHPLLIHVYTNGEPLKPAKRVLLQPWVHKTWDNVLEQIASKVLLRTGAIRKLMDLSEKTEVKCGADLRDQQFYVAVGREKFKDFEYGLSQTMFTPKQQMAKRYPTLPPIEPHERQAAKQKPNQSAPAAEKSKHELQPKPPSSKKHAEPIQDAPKEPHRTERKPAKLTTPSPDNSELEEDKTPRKPSESTTHRVSPIIEQKTPSSTTTGLKDEEKDPSINDSQPKKEANNEFSNEADDREPENHAEREESNEVDEISENAEDGNTGEHVLAITKDDADKEVSDDNPTADEKLAEDGKPTEDEKIEDDKTTEDDKPVEEKSEEDKQADNKPEGEELTENKLEDDQPADGKPADDKPADDNPADDNPADEKPANDEPTDENPVSENPPGEQPAEEEKVEDKPANDEKTNDEKPEDDAATDEKLADEKSAEETEEGKPADDDATKEKAGDEANNKAAEGDASEPGAEDNTQTDGAAAPVAENKEENNNADANAQLTAPVEQQG